MTTHFAPQPLFLNVQQIKVISQDPDASFLTILQLAEATGIGLKEVNGLFQMEEASLALLVSRPPTLLQTNSLNK